MERSLILLAAALLVYVAPGIQGTSHLSFANASQMVEISRAGCGSTKLCVETPADCDPAGNATCLFASVTAGTPVANNGTRLSIELRGNSMGYIALGLTTNATVGNTELFVCAQDTSNNGSFFFRTRNRNNADNALIASERRTTDILGMVNDNVIKCEFNIPNANATTLRYVTHERFIILLGTGTTNGTVLGAFITNLTTPLLDVLDPAANAASAGSVYSRAVLLLLSILSLSFTLKA